ncbi:sensor histidine kinase [Paenibacillus psychroresistens]|uniref:histidine kinase n=1 Tax=Paenibacillus psychroresistens TaxID=1778678 RepID=A0A6B8RRX5_9BACL|nr:sensor histidine kinase [Paenibacillus psychroresistens]QGQ98305.1 sensor histidine kinase [Paenibacillus psychroresistens]
MIKKLFSFYSDLNLRYKLFIQYLLLISVPFIIFILVNNYIASKDLEKQAQYSSQQTFEQNRTLLENKIDIIKTYLTVVSTNDTVLKILKTKSEYYVNRMGFWGFDLSEIRKQFYNAKPSIEIAQTTIYTQEAITTFNESYDFLNTSRIFNTVWYSKLSSKTSIFEWFQDTSTPSDTYESTTKYISVARGIAKLENLDDFLGFIRLDVPETLITNILDNVAFFKNSSVYLLNNKDEILSKSSSTDSNNIHLLSNLPSQDLISNLNTGIWKKHTIDGKDYLVGLQRVFGVDWHLVIFIPYAEILASQGKAIKQMLWITLFIIPFTLPLAFFAAASGTRRIRSLISQMKSVKQGDFNVRIKHESKDEIGELSRNFNSMITKVTQLLEEKYALGQDVKSMELKALQAQINPHFLYNTLDLIYWKALRIKEESIYEVVQALSKFYKLSLSKGEDIVTIRNELEHIQAYVDIQNARFKNGINLIIDVPDEFYAYKLPKITLQPLIENSIIHGILETEEERGTITISGYMDEHKFILELKDDGVGISEEKINTIFKMNTVDAFHGYGVNNINKRIKLLYGEEYGISYGYNKKTGTTVLITLPIQTNVTQSSI